MDGSLERAFRRTQRQPDAAGAVHGGVHRETLWGAANTSVSRARVGRCAIGIGAASVVGGRCAVGIGDVKASLVASPGAVPFGVAGGLSRW